MLVVGGLYIIVHECRAGQVGTVVVSPLVVPGILAVRLVVSRIGDIPVLGLQQRSGSRPVPNLVGPVGVGLVLGESRQASGQLEQAPVRDGVLHGVAGLIGPDLPANAAVACFRVPAADLHVEDSSGQRGPRGLPVDLGEAGLGRGDGGQAPEHLIVVSLQAGG